MLAKHCQYAFFDRLSPASVASVTLWRPCLSFVRIYSPMRLTFITTAFAEPDPFRR